MRLSDDDDDDGYADGEGEPCPNCGRVYRYMHGVTALIIRYVT